uniref:Uncharacterized protein n=1 Tax=Arundo donax TaxID=35708 RepID=A0A0A8XVD9_ARUDO
MYIVSKHILFLCVPLILKCFEKREKSRNRLRLDHVKNVQHFFHLKD